MANMGKVPTYRMKSRMIIVLICMIAIGFGIVLLNLFRLQVIDGDKWQSYALSQQLRSSKISANRGTIYDANGKILAKSASVWSVIVAPAEVKTQTQENAIADGLSKILEIDGAKILKKLQNKESYHEIIKTKIEQPVADEIYAFIAENDVPGIHLVEDTKRYYPYGNFAANVLGFTDYDNKGAYGLESYYEKVLGGVPGRVVSLKNAAGTTMPLQYEQTYDAQDGNSIVLTIDETVQHFLEKNLETAVVEHKVKNRAVGIVMDPNTGAILAMATKPDFDPNNPREILDPQTKEELEKLNTAENKEAYADALQQAQYESWKNKAISDPYEPGSVFKIVTASAGLESGVVTAETPFYCPGYIEVAGNVIDCWNRNKGGHGQINFEQGVMGSCNPTFITVGQWLGVDLFSDYFENFGLTKATGVDLPGEVGSIYHQRKDMGISELSSSAFGQTFKVTPLQMITAASAAVNGGKLMQPYVVKQILDPNGNVVSTTEPVVKRQVISEEISKEVSLMLEKVVSEGSGKNAYIPGYRVGGKTGTSEKLDQKQNGEVRSRISSFLGFAPADNPQVVVLVVLDEPDLANAYGSVVAAPVVGSILNDVLPYLGIEPQYTAEELEKIDMSTPYVIDYLIHDAEASIRIAGLKSRVIGNGTTVIRQTPGAGEPTPRDGTVILYTEEETQQDLIVVPDVIGMAGQEANRTIVNAGLNISISGTGIEGSGNVAVNQTPAAGTQVELGTVVTVEFKNTESVG